MKKRFTILLVSNIIESGERRKTIADGWVCAMKVATTVRNRNQDAEVRNGSRESSSKKLKGGG
ncbi:hypothetical protein A3781_15645 [Bacillus badius]|nr:hypothetical protein A3781_15645 [Bacillus badius]